MYLLIQAKPLSIAMDRPELAFWPGPGQDWNLNNLKGLEPGPRFISIIRARIRRDRDPIRFLIINENVPDEHIFFSV